MTERLSHADYVALQRRRVAEIAVAMLKGSMGMIEGSRALALLRHEVEVAEDDPDFLVFAAIESQTGHLPVGDERRRWASDALDSKADEIARAEAFAREDGSEACRNLVARFRAA